MSTKTKRSMGAIVSKSHIYFWKADSPFSQWHQEGFSDENGVYYQTAEHYMMAEKARLMGDFEMANKILVETSQRKVKSLGRKVRNWNEELYLQERENIVIRGNMLKFSQNEVLKEYILSTRNKTLVEASPNDRIWGVGLAPDNALVLDEKNWNGLNLLGKCLMRVREMIRLAEGEREKEIAAGAAVET